MSPRTPPPRDLVDVVGGDRTAGGAASPYRSIAEVVNAPDGSARRTTARRKAHFMRELREWDCPECGYANPKHMARCWACGERRPRT